MVFQYSYFPLFNLNRQIKFNDVYLYFIYLILLLNFHMYIYILYFLPSIMIKYLIPIKLGSNIILTYFLPRFEKGKKHLQHERKP